jgi:hypothetical protein
LLAYYATNAKNIVVLELMYRNWPKSFADSSKNGIYYVVGCLNTAFVKSAYAMCTFFFTYQLIKDHFTLIVGLEGINSTTANSSN